MKKRVEKCGAVLIFMLLFLSTLYAYDYPDVSYFYTAQPIFDFKLVSLDYQSEFGAETPMVVNFSDFENEDTKVPIASVVFVSNIKGSKNLSFQYTGLKKIDDSSQVIPIRLWFNPNEGDSSYGGWASASDSSFISNTISYKASNNIGGDIIGNLELQVDKRGGFSPGSYQALITVGVLAL